MASFGRMSIVESHRQSDGPARTGNQGASHRQVDRTTILLLAASAVITLAGHFRYDQLAQALRAALHGIAIALG